MRKRNNTTTADLALLGLRVTTGGLLAGHGAQKLFGVLGGYGLQGTAGWLESIGLKPGQRWALMAGASELGSGLLVALGLLTPVGAAGVFGPMLMAWNTVHAGKPIWVSSGGAELPLVNMVAAAAVGAVGPGRFSLDDLLGIEVPASVVALAIAGVAAGTAVGMLTREELAQEDQARDDLQAGQDAANAETEALSEVALGA